MNALGHLAAQYSLVVKTRFMCLYSKITFIMFSNVRIKK